MSVEEEFTFEETEVKILRVQDKFKLLILDEGSWTFMTPDFAGVYEAHRYLDCREWLPRVGTVGNGEHNTPNATSAMVQQLMQEAISAKPVRVETEEKSSRWSSMRRKDKQVEDALRGFDGKRLLNS